MTMIRGNDDFYHNSLFFVTPKANSLLTLKCHAVLLILFDVVKKPLLVSAALLTGTDTGQIVYRTVESRRICDRNDRNKP